MSGFPIRIGVDGEAVRAGAPGIPGVGADGALSLSVL